MKAVWKVYEGLHIMPSGFTVSLSMYLYWKQVCLQCLFDTILEHNCGDEIVGMYFSI